MKKYVFHIWLVMRITAIFLLIGFLHISAATKSQTVTLSVKDRPFAEILLAIQQQTGYFALSSQELLAKANPISIHIKNQPLETTLQQIFKDQPLSYEITGKNILIKEKEKTMIDAIRDALGETRHPGPDPGSTQQEPIKGRVTDSTNKPLAGASITIKGKNKRVITSEDGAFTVKADPGDSLVVTFVGYKAKSFFIAENTSYIPVVLYEDPTALKEVMVNTGYQTISKERATGSYDIIDNKLLNRAVSTDIISRLNGVASGVLFNTNRVGNDPPVSIRGRSTIKSNTNPLIVVDNFPYDGDISNINPNDVLSVTILKDAAAASIWGVRAGNGVIVITTKKGKNNQPSKVSFNTNLTFSGKPDLYSVPQLSSQQFIEVEKYLFGNGYYDGNLLYNPTAFQSPVVDILEKRRSGFISAADSASLLAALGQNDIRKDLSRYMYRPATNQQYNINVNGGGENTQYYYSVGYDKNISSQIPNSNNRITIDGKNNFSFLNKKLEIATDLFFSINKNYSTSDSYTPRYPYEKLKGPEGVNLPVYRDIRQAYKDTIGGGALLNWDYVPLDELSNRDNITNSTEYKLNISASYHFTKQLDASVNYQYTNGNATQTKLQDVNSYAVRSTINNFSQINYATGQVTRAIPLGDILTKGVNGYAINYGRGQLNYSLHGKHDLTALAGFEIRNFKSNTLGTTLYGYDPETASNSNIDFANPYPTIVTGSTQNIPGGGATSFTTDNVLSYFANAAYTYNYKYTLSASARRDESNLFGVKANQKGVPLWSLGASWNISQEDFLKNVASFPNLKIRITDGYNGNIFKSLSAYTTARLYSGDNVNIFKAPYAEIVNPPNPSLSWEKVNILNLGVDVATKNGRIAGSIDLYRKKGTDLIGQSPIAPQTGLVQFTGNTSSVLTRGMDVSATGRILEGNFKWSASAMITVVHDKILVNNANQGANSNYVGQNFTNPLEGKPYSALFSYPSGKLDEQGNPQGYVNGQLSEDYASILNSTNIGDLAYNGALTPTIYGSLLNSISYKAFSLSFNLIYKGGYYFRRGSYGYGQSWRNQADYDKIWRNPGDENKTIVPSIIYPSDGNRVVFFGGSDKLVEKGDNLRLKDIQASYSFSRKGSWPQMQLYAYVNNLNVMLYSANKINLDPDFSSGGYALKVPVSYSLGININF